MRKNKISDALGTVDPAFLQEAAEFTAQPTSLFGKQTFRVLGICATLVLAVGIALAVAPRLPAILPPNTDTSHIQGTTNTTDHPSDTETDSSTETGVTDTGIGSTDTSADPSTDTSTDSTDSNVTEEKRYVIYVELSAGAGEIKLPEGRHELKRLESKFKFSFSNSYSELGKTLSEDQKKPITFLLNGKQVQITPTKAYSTPFANSKNEALKMENTYFEVDDKTATLMYTNEGRLVLYLNRDRPESTSAMTIEQLKTTATNVLEDLYGKDFVSKYVIANVATSEMLSGNRGSVRFVRQVHGYDTEDYIQVAFDGFELLSIYALTSGYMDVVTDLTKEDIQAAENYLTQSMKLTLDHCEVTIDTDGELFLKARTEDAFYWISIE